MTARRIFCVLSAKALPYARHCVATLFANCLETVDLTLITDGPEDKRELEAALVDMAEPAGKAWRVADMADCDALAEETFADYPNIARFRRGHPCWRKCADPLLFIEQGEEAIILDPDLYFPNQFAFEQTPATGVLIMRQGPNCLYPPEAVERAFAIPVRLADHVDIGVAQLRMGGIDLAWLDDFLGRLGFDDFTDFMHIEAIVWSALGMAFGGGYLDPAAWRCWQRGQLKRVAIAAGAPGPMLLRLEPLSTVKCIHVSGPSKWWVVDAIEKGALKSFDGEFAEPTPIAPFIEFTKNRFDGQQRLKNFARRAGYYRLTKSA